MASAAISTSIPSPVGGWNARDSLGDMPASDAASMVNWFPSTTECVVRHGYTKWSTGYPSTVETIFSYAGPAAVKLFGVCGGAIYDATAGGAIGASVVSGLSNSRFQYVNMETAGGNFLLAVNGTNKMQYFDGTTWTVDGGTYTVTVADTSKWSNICIHKQRVWAIEGASLKAWYMPTQSIAGAAALFDLSAFFQLGGHLVSVATWTIDGGQGVDDYLVFVSSRGEVLLYYGIDPTGTWAMKGLYRVGSPIGSRCMYKFAGDLLIICQDGVMPLSSALQSSRVDPTVAVSNKIQNAVSNAVSLYGANFGWQLLNFPRENMLFLNVPVATGAQQQYVMNTITKAWTSFSGWPALCFELYQDAPYFGANGYIGKAWDQLSDDSTNIVADAIQAFDYLRRPGIIKQVTMCRPVLRASGLPSVQVSVNIDFDLSTMPSSITLSPPTASLWGSAIWGSSLWGVALNVYNDWQGASGVGYSVAPRVIAISNGIETRWVATDIVYKLGAIL
jgi:hypothetical protein